MSEPAGMSLDEVAEMLGMSRSRAVLYAARKEIRYLGNDLYDRDSVLTLKDRLAMMSRWARIRRRISALVRWMPILS